MPEVLKNVVVQNFPKKTSSTLTTDIMINYYTL